MAELYPAFLNLQGRTCLVVGGGAVAERKVQALLRTGARLTVVAPAVTDRLRTLAKAGEIVWRERPFEAEDLDGMALAFIATSSAEVNALVAAEARNRSIWANVADAPELCDFQVPAALRRGRAAVAISTGGASPTLAAWLRDRVAEALPAAVTELVELAEALRNRPGAEKAALRRLLDAGILEDLVEERREEVGRKIALLFGEIPEVRRLLTGRSAEAP